MKTLLPAVTALMLATPSWAQPVPGNGFATALTACEAWIFDPATWAYGVDDFPRESGLGSAVRKVKSIDKAALPPPPLRVANHYWRINSGQDAGYILVVSDIKPFCHITGGGESDLQPDIEAVLGSEDFHNRWEPTNSGAHGDLGQTWYRHRKHPAFSMLVSRPNGSVQTTGAVQVIVTAIYELEK